MRGLRALIGALMVAWLTGTCLAGVGPEYEGLASFGISVGAMQWLADSDARDPGQAYFESGGAAQMRPAGRAAFRYRFDSTWVLAVEVGFGWNSYPESRDLVLTALPLTVGLERRVTEILGASTSFCFGAGLYSWALRRDGTALRDPQTQQEYAATDPGAYVGLVAETPISRALTLFGQTTANFIYSAHSDDFKAAFNGSDVYADLRIGLHYHFSPREGLLPPEPPAGQGR